ncbi:DUF5309 family protein [Solibacillus sp. FSL R7-0682]|uniref:SU10 major capsid protein n=1 Tax=Solibacillus sp. FSL R7-0682 TaxID=2921690 RepID=UPI0030F619BD
MTQIQSTTYFTPAEQVSLSQELAILGVQSTPLTSLLLSKGNVEKAMAVVHSWREQTLDTTDDISFTEGSETTVFQASVRRELNNMLQIFKKAVSISGTAQAMKIDEFPSEIKNRLLELKINLEKTLINGLKDDASTSGVRKMSGLIEFADANNAVTGRVNDAGQLLVSTLEKLWNNNLIDGEQYVMVNAQAKQAIDAQFESQYRYIDKTTTFGLVVRAIETNFGIVNVVLSKHVPVDKAVVFNIEYLDLVALREATFEPLAKTGDSTKGQVVGEYSLKVGSPKAVGVITFA